MRFGGPLFGDCSDPQYWTAALKKLGYSAAYCPVGDNATEAQVRDFAAAAAKANIVIAEVGAWSNPMSPDPAERKAALAKCQNQLALAERIGARCCVNIAGSCGKQWDGPDPANLTKATFDQIVQTTRAIIDAVKPTRTVYSLETMPWMYPDSADSYLALIKAIDRKGFGVHLDPVNIVASPQAYYGSAALLRECFEKLGPHIKSCHAKDIALAGRLTVHLDEVIAGRGGLCYRTFLQELSKLDADTPLMLEHLEKPEQYDEAAAHIRGVAKEMGLAWR